MPLVVVVHGCQTTAEQQMRSALFNQVAERERFVVLYDQYNNDTRAPSAAELSWSIFERYRLSDTAMPCATTEPNGRPSAPPARAVDFALPTPSTRVEAAVTPRPAAGTLPSTGAATSGATIVLLSVAGLALRRTRRPDPNR